MMKKYHRLLIYVVFFGLVFSFFIIISITISEKFKQNENRRFSRQLDKKLGDAREEYGDAAEASKNGTANIEEETRRLLRIVESENNFRLERIVSACKKYNLGLFRTGDGLKIEHPPVPHYSVFYFDRDNKYSFCPVYKAGSSTWLYNMCLLAGMTDEEIATSKQQISALARIKYPELEPLAAEEALRDSIKIMTVRHPFERLLSAYRDKLENTNYGLEHGTAFFYRKFGTKIVGKYRKNGNKTKVWDLLKPSQYSWDPEKPKPAGVEPTFREFVKYLINTNLIQHADDHWIPYYLYCTPCLLHYDVIAKVETMDRDQLYAIRLLGLENQIKPLWRHKTQFITSEANHTDHNYVSDLAKIYFRQITVDEINSLFEKYKIDFDLFGYDYEEYIKYAQDYENGVSHLR